MKPQSADLFDLGQTTDSKGRTRAKTAPRSSYAPKIVPPFDPRCAFGPPDHIATIHRFWYFGSEDYQ